MHQLTQARLKELFCYDESTGHVTRRFGIRSRAKGAPVGALDSDGYLVTKIDRKLYKLHRLIWLYMTGRWPTDQIDHINGKPADNSWRNLREATGQQNLQNRVRAKVAASGVRGVELQRGRYRVRVCINGQNKSFGTYGDLELAELVAIEARNKYHGEFANHVY